MMLFTIVGPHVHPALAGAGIECESCSKDVYEQMQYKQGHVILQMYMIFQDKLVTTPWALSWLPEI